MIPKIFHLFWHKGPMSYLRYLTFATLRKFHPDWDIRLVIASEYAVVNWSYEKQDFQGQSTDDWGPRVAQICNSVTTTNKYSGYAPNFQSDFYRWDALGESGGFYLDTDQIILRPFDDLLDKKFIYTVYENYTPVGAIGAERNLPIIEKIRSIIKSRYNPNDYNSIGPYMFTYVYNNHKSEFSEFYNAGKLFYPAYYSSHVGSIYNGTLDTSPQDYALHWFGGHPLSQNFNNTYTEDKTKTSSDTISKLVRKILY